MRGEKFGAVEAIAYSGPELPKCWRVGDIGPGNAVQVRERKRAARRTNEKMRAVDDATAGDQNHRDGTSAVAAVVRRLEIDGGELKQRRIREGRLAGHESVLSLPPLPLESTLS